MNKKLPFLPDPFFGYLDTHTETNNKQINLRVELDGTITRRVRLSVDNPFLREKIILSHFVQHLSSFEQEELAYLILDRDNPWDFEVLINNQLNVNIEITSISDNTKQFIWQNDQDKLLGLLKKEKPNESDYIKLRKYFNIKFLNKVKTEIETKGIFQQLMIEHQSAPENSLIVEVQNAINKKLNKKHLDKDKTILIIDNRISYATPNDILTLQAEISPELLISPFNQIWFYTGGFSDNDGKNAAFYFCQLK